MQLPRARQGVHIENPVQRSRARALAGARRAECRRYSQRCSCLPVRAHDPPAQRPRYFGFSFFFLFPLHSVEATVIIFVTFHVFPLPSIMFFSREVLLTIIL